MRMRSTLLLIGSFLLGMTMMAAQSQAEPWPDGKQAAVVLTYDDALSSHLNIAIPALDAAGLKGTFFVVGSQLVPEQIPLWRAAAAQGHELGNHTVRHACPQANYAPARKLDTSDSYDGEMMLAEIRTMNTMLTAIDGKLQHGFATPCGQHLAGGVDYLPALRASGLVRYTRSAAWPGGKVLDPMDVPCRWFDETATGADMIAAVESTAQSGVIQGYDAVTGKLVWAWDMVRPERTGAPPPGETYTRGTPNMWTTATADEALGLVYLPLGNSAVDYWSGLRTSREKAHSTSLVALDAATGRKVWSFQAVHNDVWDYDLGSQATLVDFPTAHGPVPAVILPSKQGDIYVLNRRTGSPLTGIQERRVPTGGVEPRERSATQPFSLYHTLRKPDLTERSMWGMSPIDQMICRIQYRLATYKGFYTPPETQGRYVEYPGYNGGSDWGGVAVDPVHGVIVANYNDMPNYNRLIPRAEADRKGWAPRGQERGGSLKKGAEGAGDPQAGTPYAIDVNAGWRLPLTGLLCKQPPYGGLRAIDLLSGKTLWDRPLGTARTNGPFGIPSHLPLTIGTPNNGGAVVTAGGVIFIAAATDNLIRAVDLKSGRTLWQDVLPAGGQATPMTYAVDGKQYVVIMAGGHHFMETPIGDALVAYALPGPTSSSAKGSNP